MLVDIRVHRGHQQVEFVGDIPAGLQGPHQNMRSASFAGCINHAVDILIAHRFELELSGLALNIPVLGEVVRLNTFLAAGGFDEFISDRRESIYEFKLRLFEVEDQARQYQQTLQQLIATNPSPRLLSKLLLRQGEFPPAISASDVPDHEPLPKGVNATRHLSMTLCVTFGDMDLVFQFVNSLADSCSSQLELHLVACCHRVDAERVEQLVRDAGVPFASVRVLPESWGHEEGKSGRLGPWYKKAQNRQGVSWGRCVLHRAAAAFSPTDAKWILDDDIIFEANTLQSCNESFISMMTQGLAVGIGAIVGDAPIPAAYMLRTQVIDFYYRGFLKEKIENNLHPIAPPFHDMHHDLSTSRSDHLEFPLGVHAACGVFSFDDAVLFGRSVTRPTHCEWRQQVHLRPRGGNTLVLGNEPLLQVSNMAPNLGGIMSRRGDTLWALRFKQKWPTKIGNVDLALTQSRRDWFALGNADEVRGDIIGSMLSRLIERGTVSLKDVVHNIMMREARLISNLQRVEELLERMRYFGNGRNAVRELLNELISTPWPMSLQKDMADFLRTYPTDEASFRRAGAVI